MQNLILCAMILMLGFSAAQAAEEEQPSSASSAYVSIGDPLILNLSGPKRLTFLQLSADVLINDSDAEETIKTHVPAIRHT